MPPKRLRLVDELSQASYLADRNRRKTFDTRNWDKWNVLDYRCPSNRERLNTHFQVLRTNELQRPLSGELAGTMTVRFC